MLLQVEGIGKKIGEKWMLQNLHFKQERFQKLAIAGETGSGKSTLLRIIAGWEHPDAGAAFFEGKKVNSPLEVLLPGHPGIAYLSQHFELRANYYVWELLSYANQLDEAEARELFALCRIDHLLQRKVDQLSGGEKQRIALARLLVGAPRLLLLDEPFSNLDLAHKETLKKVLADIAARLQITCLLTSHDPLDTLAWANEILVMRAGEKRQQADPRTIYDHPADAYVAALFGPFNLVTADIAQHISGAPVIDGRQLFIRPEQLRVTCTQENPLATVENLYFNGMFTLLEVSLQAFTLYVKTTARHFAQGDRVTVSLADDYDPHFLD